MKKIILALFIALSSAGFAQQQSQINRTYYYYSVLDVQNEQTLQQVVDEISAFKGINDCKYRIKPEKKMAEITFYMDEQALFQKKGEGDKGDPLPDAKKLILDKGLKYNGFTSQTEKITN